MDANELLQINGISKRYGHHMALEPFSLSVKRGQAVALCGGNGAGKSTLIQILAGIIPPSEGQVVLAGRLQARDRREYARNIGYMPDDFQLPATLTVFEWLSFYAALRRVPPEQVIHTLRRVGLSEKQSARCSELSKGMRQRLLFAQACVASPKLLLLDEPTNGLDPYWMEAFAATIREMRDEGQTVLFSTHQVDIAAEVADHLIYMHEGKVLHRFDLSETPRFEVHQQLLSMIRSRLNGGL